MATITLTSHYNNYQVNLRVSKEVAEKIKTSDNPIEIINGDLDAYHYGFAPFYLTRSQCRKIKSFFAAGSIDYFDNVICNN